MRPIAPWNALKGHVFHYPEDDIASLAESHGLWWWEAAYFPLACVDPGWVLSGGVG